MGCNAVAEVSGQQLEHTIGLCWPKFAVETLYCVGDESLYVLSAPQDRLHLRQFPSSPSEDYLTVLAGQRQWIATTNFAGCPGRPPDSFANSAVLTTSAKVPDALGWPIDPCFPVQIDPKAEQFEQVVACADQRPFAVHLLQSPQQELPESPALLDLAEYRLHSIRKA